MTLRSCNCNNFLSSFSLRKNLMNVISYLAPSASKWTISSWLCAMLYKRRMGKTLGKGTQFLGARGVLTYLAKRGCAALMVAFLQEILKYGSRFLPKKSLNMSQHFWLSPNFRVLAWQNPQNREIFEKLAYFSRKILKNGYPFLPNSPLKMGRGFEARAAHPCPTQISVPPPPGFRGIWWPTFSTSFID